MPDVRDGLQNTSFSWGHAPSGPLLYICTRSPIRAFAHDVQPSEYRASPPLPHLLIFSVGDSPLEDMSGTGYSNSDVKVVLVTGCSKGGIGFCL